MGVTNDDDGHLGIAALVDAMRRGVMYEGQVHPPQGASHARAYTLPAITGALNITLGEVTLQAHAVVKHPSPDVMLGASIVLLGEKVTDGEIVEAVALSWAGLVRELERDPNLMLRFDPRQLEEIIAAAYHADGFEVVLTPRSGDLGRDVIATKPGRYSVRFLDQVKRYKPGTVVTADEVRAMYGVLALDQRASKAYITTTSSFAPGTAAEFRAAIPTRLDLRDGQEVQRWMRELGGRQP